MIIVTSKDKNSIRLYLNTEYNHSLNNKKCKSSYFAALSHGRSLTGRNSITGIIENSDKTGDWAGACMYIILIDHIGKKFKNSNKIISEKNSFLEALASFTTLTELERVILYQLRNSFLHQFNLYDIPKDKDYIPRHFAVNRGDTLITLPTSDFDGNLNNISIENATIISLPKLCDLVEEMHKNILDCLDKNLLNAVIPSGFTLEALLSANTICY